VAECSCQFVAPHLRTPLEVAPLGLLVQLLSGLGAAREGLRCLAVLVALRMFFFAAAVCLRVAIEVLLFDPVCQAGPAVRRTRVGRRQSARPSRGSNRSTAATGSSPFE
jgi:hypothetical protein